MSIQPKAGIEQVENIVERLAMQICAPSYLLPTFGRSEDLGRPQVVVDASGYHFVVVERGVEQSRVTTQSIDDLLFEIFRGVASAMGFQFEMQQSKRDVDPRGVAFAQALSILGALSPDWERRQRVHYEQVLSASPLRT